MAQIDWTGETLSERYRLEELLGQGGMSAVYKAHDPNLRRPVAVKIIHPHLSAVPQFVRRFEEEAAAVAQLRHPNLIQVHDFNHDGDTYYIVFEYVPGETLQTRLQRLHAEGVSMAPEQAIDIAAQCAEGLAYAHDKGVVHRDIKPSNIILNENGQAIITDFGIAKLLDGTKLTATGAIIGSIPYMSPEQIEGLEVDARSDIYSLGITLFEALAGSVPFDSDSAVTLMLMHVKEPVPDLHQIRPELPLKLVETTNQALAKAPEDRYQTASEFAFALRRDMGEPGLPIQEAEETVIEPLMPEPAAPVPEAPAAVEPIPPVTKETAPPAAVAERAAQTAEPAPEKPSSRRNWIILLVLITILLCICCSSLMFIGYLGDQGLI